MHVLWDARGSVQRNRRLHGIHFLLRDIVLAQKSSRTVGTIHFESVAFAAVFRSQSHIVEHCANVEQLGAEVPSSLFSW
jgi:hypothetical protein